MLSCQVIARDNDELYDAVSASRPASVLSALQLWAPSVKASYRNYDALVHTMASRVSIMDDPSGVEGGLLRGNWDLLNRQSFAETRRDALLASSGICCLCGYASAGEVDHHLPKSQFPEYSIFTENLIAACGRCNRKKASRYQRAGGGPAFVHPYKHKLPDEQFLTCSVSFDETVLLCFDVVRTPEMEESTFTALHHHFRALDLASLYLNEAIGAMGEQLNNYYAYYRAGGADGVSRYLAAEARSSLAWHRSRGNLTRNHWKPVLLSTLARSVPFCEGGFELLGPELALD